MKKKKKSNKKKKKRKNNLEKNQIKENIINDIQNNKMRKK